MSDPWKECMDHCVEVTKKAGEMVREALLKDIAVMQKSSPVDLVTETDQKVEQLIISSIKEKYPTHSFIGEESVAAGAPSVLTDNPTWIIDPIDGTTNFVHRFPFVSISIGFTVKKEIEFGIVYSCIEDKMYTAQKGKGAFCNGVPIKVSGQEDITQSLVLTEMGFKKDPEQFKTMLANIKTILTIPVHGIRSPGSAAVNMCLVACGSADAYYHMGIHCWDMAGGAVVVTEAGGVIMDISGGPFDLMSRRLIVASSRAIAERIVKEIKEFNVGRDDTDN
ncbi:inositol monophosphatase 1-like isoform X3 [Trachinotus anak]|uniref:inositol monophosphatase 1-like isoform X3 n=1 Tax=Trachinotus anak TaxID=443729 RepID=UPI0039F20D78